MANVVLQWKRNKVFVSLVMLLTLLISSYWVEYVAYAAPVAEVVVAGATTYWVWDQNGSDSVFGYTKENTAYATTPGFADHDIEGLDCVHGVMYAVSGRGGKAPSSLYAVVIDTAVSTLTKIADIDRGGGLPAFEATALAHKMQDHSLWVFIDWTGMRGIYRLALDGKATLIKETTVEAEAMAWLDDTLWLASGSKVYSFQPGGAIVHRFSIPAAKTSGIEGMDAVDGKLYIGIHDQGIVAVNPTTGVIVPEPGFPAESDIEGLTFCEDRLPPATPTSTPLATSTSTPLVTSTTTPTTVLTVLPTLTSTPLITSTSTPTSTSTGLPTITPTSVVTKSLTPTPAATLDNHPTPTPVVRIQTCTLGGITWDDQLLYRSTSGTYANGADGILQEAEARIAGVTVDIINSAGQVVATTTTASDGTYLFPEIICGSYIARFQMPADEYIGITIQDVVAEYGSDPDQTTGLTSVFTLTPGEYTHVDAGWVRQPTAENVAQEPGMGRLTIFLCRGGDSKICGADAAPAAHENFVLTYMNRQGFSTSVSASTGADGVAVFDNAALGQWQVSAACLVLDVLIHAGEPSVRLAGNVQGCAKTSIYLPFVRK